MFIKRTSKTVKGKSYVNHLLVESVSTPKGPRHRVICSLGSLEAAPAAQWLALAHRVEHALAGQDELFSSPLVDQVLGRARAAGAGPAASTAAAQGPADASPPGDLVTVHTDQVEMEEARAAGAVHVGHQMWQRLGLDAILQEVGLPRPAQQLSELMTLNRLIAPCSEHAMPRWAQRTALGEVLGMDLAGVDDDALYRHLDRLHPQRGAIEQRLREHEQDLFALEDALYIYDVTSTYFEGQCLRNPLAQRGYSRDHRPDCKQVLVGLVIDGQGFPRAHEVFEGRRQDRQTVDHMLGLLERRRGGRGGGTVIVDRGMAYDDNLATIQAHQHHYIVACRQVERAVHLEALAQPEGWKPRRRPCSPTNAAQHKSEVWVKPQRVGDELHVLCRSQARREKERAIRQGQEDRLLVDLRRLQRRVAQRRLVHPAKIQAALGRLAERYPRVARYYRLTHEASTDTVAWEVDLAAQQQAEQLDGTYLLKTDRLDLDEEELWRTYILLTRAEAAFRAMKSPLEERPIFHQLQHRVETHIFLCVLAYHLLVSLEQPFLARGQHTSWATLREELSTHQLVTVCLPASDGRVLKIRRSTRPEPTHAAIYDTLGMPAEIIKPVRTWHTAAPS
ncbi:MAG: IS1634 family transposase [Candidatus Latescibacterota bacterium]